MTAKLTGLTVKPVTRADFPLGVPVIIESIIDNGCGWEFDAPMHIVAPFHRYFEVSSTGVEAVESKIEDLMIDLDCELTLNPCDSCWPYSQGYFKRLINQARKGTARRGVNYFRSIVTVHGWSGGGRDCVDYDISTELIREESNADRSPNR